MKSSNRFKKVDSADVKIMFSLIDVNSMFSVAKTIKLFFMPNYVVTKHFPKDFKKSTLKGHNFLWLLLLTHCRFVLRWPLLISGLSQMGFA